jgi:hypothetical protein
MEKMKMADKKYDILPGIPAAAETGNNHPGSILPGLIFGDASFLRIRKRQDFY